MKKVILLFLCLTLAVGLAGCGGETDEEVTIYDMIDVFRDAQKQGGVIGAETRYVETLQELILGTKFRVRGMVSNIKTEYEYFIPADLYVGEEKYDIYFTPDTEITDGEYVEVVGYVNAGDGSYPLLYDATVIERGSTVKEKITN